MQEMTGIRLFQEQEILLDEMQYKNFYNKINIDESKINTEIVENNKKQICEIYFDSATMEEVQPEQFMLAMEQKGKRKSFILKRKNKIGKYESEKSVKISKEQYRKILQGSLDWMKESSKTLLKEFYFKTKLFQYKISKIIKCYREEIYMKYENLLLIIDENMKEYSAQNIGLDIINENEKVCVKVRSTVGKENRDSKYIFSDLIN